MPGKSGGSRVPTSPRSCGSTRAVVEPLEHDHPQITIVDPARTLDDLMPIGLTNRPELGSYQAMVQATVQRVRRRRHAPSFPAL